MKGFWAGLVLVLAGVAVGGAQAPVAVTPALDERVDAMIAKMSVEDKLRLIGGEDRFFTRAVPSIGLKRLKMSDGPVGLRTFGQSTAYTAGVAVAASWDPALAEEVGASLGDDARARGVNFLLGPGMNIYRSPLNGRNMEYFGEDPYLAGRIAAGYILGVQSKGVSATAKHYAANNSEYDRHRINSVIDERVLREIYLPAFEASVKQGHVTAIMDSYNLVNGEHSTQNGHLNNEILKGDWGFQGVVMSDWDATYDGVAAANGGLDLEMPYAKLMTPETLKAALKDGSLKMSVLDEKVRRILRVTLQYGWMDRDQYETEIPLDSLHGDQVALDEARGSFTLLKNEGALLPLDAKKLRTIAIVGPEAATAVVGGGGSSNTTPFEAQSFVAGFTRYLGGAKVLYVPALPEMSEIVRTTKFAGMKLEARREGKVVSTQDVTAIGPGKNAGGASFEGMPKGELAYRWQGRYEPASSGSYVLIVSEPDADAYAVAVDGKTVLTHAAGNTLRSGHTRVDTADVMLTSGSPAKIEVTYASNKAPQISIALVAKSEMLPEESKKVIRGADAVLVAAGFGPASEGEGFDRTYAMPGAQNELIEEVAALNPKTIVAITAGGSVETAPWIAQVPALIHNYYPGQEGARALAEIVFGERSPEGHLPFSWEKTLDQNPASAHYEEEDGGKMVHYGEGLFLGYRYYTSKNVQPLFPFGFGLSYTSFEYTHLEAKRVSDDDVEVSFDVKNSGRRAGAAVPQIYVGEPGAKVERPVEELKQFAKVRLGPGEHQHVVLHLDRRAFEYWSTERKGWTLDPGMFEVSLAEDAAAVKARVEVKMF